ncbi:MAG: radical SAM protein, partial [Geobacteraceae bacterium]|nr:radical SAM protein [Geobacteraceae bacterium]
LPRVIQRCAPLEGDKFATPLFEADMVEYYLQHSGMVNLQTKRGCPYRCSYCSYPHLEGRTFRIRSPQLVVAELERLRHEHGVERVFFTDSVFNDPQGHYLELCEEIIRRKLEIQWAAFFRPQGMGRAELALMKRAGLYALELGTDAGADKTLAGIDKNLTYADIFAVNEACIAERLPAAHYVMFGGPNEDESTVLEALDNIERLGVSVVFAFSGIRIHPGAPLHQRAIADGVVSADDSLLKPVYYFSPEVDQRWMEEKLEEGFAGRKTRIFPPDEGLKRIAVMKDFGYRGLLWDKLVRFPQTS